MYITLRVIINTTVFIKELYNIIKLTIKKQKSESHVDKRKKKFKQENETKTQVDGKGHKRTPI